MKIARVPKTSLDCGPESAPAPPRARTRRVALGILVPLLLYPVLYYGYEGETRFYENPSTLDTITTHINRLWFIPFFATEGRVYMRGKLVYWPSSPRPQNRWYYTGGFTTYGLDGWRGKVTHPNRSLQQAIKNGS